MSWAVGWDDHWERDIGYGVPAYCDHPLCSTKIDRGLDHVCGGKAYGGQHGCGLYFCYDHRVGYHQQCEVCSRGKITQLNQLFSKKPDHPQWVWHKLTHESWQGWREIHKGELQAIEIGVVKVWVAKNLHMIESISLLDTILAWNQQVRQWQEGA